MRTFVAVTPFMVRDRASDIPRHFAPSSGPIPEEKLLALAPDLPTLADSFLEQGVIREYDPEGKDKTPEPERLVSVGKAPEPMLYVRHEPLKKGKR